MTGDCGDALYQLTEEATLERLAHYDMAYLFGKLRCMDSEGGLSFDTDTAVEGIRWFAKEYGEPQTSEAQECFNEVIEAAEECSSLSEWNQRLAVFDSSSYVFSDYFGTEWYEWMPSCGEVYSYQAVAFWLGLRMAYTQLHYGKEV